MSGDDRIQLRLTVHELEAIERALRAARALEMPAVGKPAMEDALQAVEVALTVGLPTVLPN
jgi:hypothetical protein